MKTVSTKQATIYEVELTGEGLEGTTMVPYRLIIIDEGEGITTWELYQFHLEYEDCSGFDGMEPPVASVADVELVAYGMGGCDPDRAVSFVQEVVERTHRKEDQDVRHPRPTHQSERWYKEL